MKTIVPEIDEIVNFYSPDVVEAVARDTGFVQRESKLGGVEFLGIMTQGLYSRPDATLDQMVAMGRDINEALEISPEGLHQRFINAYGLGGFSERHWHKGTATLCLGYDFMPGIRKKCLILR